MGDDNIRVGWGLKQMEECFGCQEIMTGGWDETAHVGFMVLLQTGWELVSINQFCQVHFRDLGKSSCLLKSMAIYFP